MIEIQQPKSLSMRGAFGAPGKTFFILAEGSRTEYYYFVALKKIFKNVILRPITNKKQSAPLRLLERAKRLLRDKQLEGPFEIWVLTDRDNWKKEHLDELARWAKENPNCHFALSNPKFEYWLLLHFRYAGSVTSRQCTELLRRHLPHFEKQLKKIFTREEILCAVKHSKRRDNPPCTGWPQDPGQTTVYRLIENISRANEEHARAGR